MKKCLLILLISTITFPLVSSAQNSPLNNRGVEIHLMPLSILKGSERRIRLGAGLYTGNKMAYSLDIGVGTSGLYERSGSSYTRTIKEDFLSFEVKPEIKYFYKQKEGRQLFFALELIYIRTSNTYVNGFYYPLSSKNNSGFRFDEAKRTQSKTGAGIKIGSQIIGSGKPFFLELYVGLGSVKLKRNYTNVINPIEDFIEPTEEWGSSSASNKLEKNQFIPHLSLGFKIGYIFWRK